MPMQMGQRRGSSWQLPSGSSFTVYSGWQGNWVKDVGTHEAGATSSWVWPCLIPLSRIFQNCNQIKHMSSLGGRLQQGRRVRVIFLQASLCRACPWRPHSPESGSAASLALLISGQHQEQDQPARAAGHKRIRHRSTIALQTSEAGLRSTGAWRRGSSNARTHRCASCSSASATGPSSQLPVRCGQRPTIGFGSGHGHGSGRHGAKGMGRTLRPIESGSSLSPAGIADDARAQHL